MLVQQVIDIVYIAYSLGVAGFMLIYVRKLTKKGG
jgi:hypothetical protein